ncbi:MAG: CRTAC1 family protein, partial [Planctomycetia bacterium]|nr:CRTAC1 family protein [Planctomycetia bacterium]
TPDTHRFIGQPKERAEKSPVGAVETAEDADIDLLIYGDDGVLFLKNVFDKTSKTRSLQAVCQDESFETLRDVLAISTADIDHDGDLDLVISSGNGSGITVWQNNDSREHTKFADISSRSALPPKDLKATVLLPVDWNFDVQMDVLVTGPDVSKPGWLENVSHGRLRWHDWQTTESQEPPIWNFNSLQLVRLQKAKLRWELARVASLGARLWDFDNDGARDQLEWDADKLINLKSIGSDKESAQPLTAMPLSKVALCEVADFDGDGDEDVLAVTDQRAIWIRNDGGNKNNWIDLSIRADKDRKPQRDSERVNAHGVGSLVELRTHHPGRHVRVVEGQSTHFGLGSTKQVDAARIIWTNGVPQNILHPKAGQPIAAQQVLKGSCPYLYTWDGEKWVFFTDCLWAAPIGLQFAEGVYAKPREWEYLQVDGDRMKEFDGEYRLLLTEELWEAAYFDQVRLLAVDHPADVEIYSNEKVGPPSIAEFKLHPVRKRHVPVAAHDHRGRDVLDRLARRDERYLRAFDKIIQQGLAEEHFIELDLGDLSDAQSATLFLTGWIFPTDTSINVSLSQNPDLDAPRPPSIWIPSDNGEWREAISYIGFPGGKTKTIAVDLTKALGLKKRDGDLKSEISNLKSTRIRIVTSMELYWDEMFFTVDEADVEHSITEMPILAADLQYRGFSARLPHPEFGPERYDATEVSTAPQWPPMGGKFTRYGDVTELLTEADDRMAILGAGDAVTIRFRAATSREKLPSGWKRDFILHNVGYDKDADLNTVYGQFVEPLPFTAMQGYPDATGAEYPDSDKHRDYLRRFQTREQNRMPFWNNGTLLTK